MKVVNKMRIPIYKPMLDQAESKNVMSCLESTWISSKGAYIEEFEERFASYSDVGYATTVANGTVALHLALLSLGIKAGDEVILPAFTYVASANTVLHCNATPVFVDIEENFWQMDIQKIEGQPRTEAKPQQPLGNDVFSALKQDPIFPSIEVAEKSVPIGTKYNVGNKFYRKQ